MTKRFTHESGADLAKIKDRLGSWATAVLHNSPNIPEFSQSQLYDLGDLLAGVGITENDLIGIRQQGNRIGRWIGLNPRFKLAMGGVKIVVYWKCLKGGARGGLEPMSEKDSYLSIVVKDKKSKTRVMLTNKQGNFVQERNYKKLDAIAVIVDRAKSPQKDT